MKKQTVASLTKKGWSQKKIALTLHIRKTKVVAEQKKLRIGKRAVGGATRYWKDVSDVMKATGAPRAEASSFVGRTRKWGTKRAARVGKKWRPIPERQKFWKEWKAKWRASIGEEKRIMEEKAMRWKSEEWTGDTPK